MHIVFIYIYIYIFCLFLSKSKVYLFCEMTIGVFCFWWFLHHRIRVALKQPCLLARQSWKSLLFDVSSIQSLLDMWVYPGKEALIPFWLLYFTQSTVAFGKVWKTLDWERWEKVEKEEEFSRTDPTIIKVPVSS